MRKIPYTLAVVLCISALLAGCNLPFLANSKDTSIETAAAQTVQAQLTAAAPATATFTPVPFPTIPPLATTQAAASATLPATAVCDQGQFISDVTIPDGTAMDPGETFTKTWRLENAGTCTWSGYNLVFDSGDLMGGTSPIAIGTVGPGQEVDLSVNLTAPSANGDYRGYWRVRNANGVLLPILNGYQGRSFYVDVTVGTTAAFAVTSVKFTVTGSCPDFHIVVAITTNAAGTVTYHRVFSDGSTDPSPGSLVFDSAGTKSVSYDIHFATASSSAWMDLYVDTPNHQQFSRANYSCP